MSEAPGDLVVELLAESLVAWRLAGEVARLSDAAIVISGTGKAIRIEAAPERAMFRWLVTIDGRRRNAVSVVALLRQVREALDPDHVSNRLRIAIAPLVPPA